MVLFAVDEFIGEFQGRTDVMCRHCADIRGGLLAIRKLLSVHVPA